MSQWTTKKRLEFAARRAGRMALVGRALEMEVERYLGELKSDGTIADYVRHLPHSAEDHNGWDFTVQKAVGEEIHSVSFGVTISLQRWHQSQQLHPAVPQLCFPIGTKRETMIRRILELFNGK